MESQPQSTRPIISISNAPIPFSEVSNPTEFDFLQPTTLVNNNEPPASLELLSNPKTITKSRASSANSNSEAKFFKLPTKRWIDMTVFSEIPVVDPVLDTLAKYNMKDSSRKSRTEDSESTDIAQLMSQNSWRALAKLARKRLLACHPGQVSAIMRLWFLRLTALVRLRLLDVVALELDRLGDFHTPELMFERYPDVFVGRTGSMVSLELRLFVAQFSAVRGDLVGAVNKVYQLLLEVRRSMASSNDEKQRELMRSQIGVLQIVVVNNLLEMKDYSTAIDLMDEVVDKYHSNPDIISVLGRMYLQLGDLPSARNTFSQVEKLVLWNSERNAWRRPDLVLMNRAYLHIAENDWETANSVLTELLTIDPSNSVAVNNLAICQLYIGNVGQAISFLESIAIDMPTSAGICEPLLFNLATLFDLMDQSTERKKKLLASVVAKNAGDDFAIECLKL
ncbi:Trafficking protein particle complex subunit 12 [Nowakowskiella sp. JEL0078]|nr:Trafficking protein particle complex subunit 12 [Nowakowskiella sp. JEL0078]